jgi:3-phosphoshikimate 1-carboxyvinyltransferase
MKLRPIASLVDALRELGCRIDYVEEQGFPPLEFQGFEYSGNNHLEIDASSSSQFISSLVMAAPSLPDGLKITLTGEISSSPYIFLTTGMMQACGIEIQVIGNQIVIPAQKWNHAILKPEADWSAASYWFGILANQKRNASYFLTGLKFNSLQGDKVIAELARFWNVGTEEKENGILISKTSNSDSEKEFSFDFSACPDLALTIIVLCAAKGTKARLSGLASLKIKESDRLSSIARELQKLGLEVLVEDNGNVCWLSGTEIIWPDEMVVFETYDDHRIAMALSILLASGNQSARFLQPEVVNKSYPGFWGELTKAGFKLNS